MKNKTALSLIFILLILVTGCTPAKPVSVSVPVPEPAYWPTAGWQAAAPETQGMDSALLARMLEEINTSATHIHSVLVIRNGYLVTEAYFAPYTRDTKIQIQSVTKSVIGALTGIALRDGKIGSVDDPLLEYFSFPGRTFENPGANKDAIRLKHLLSMTSGFPCQEFTSSGQSMEQSSGWVKFMLDLPVPTAPGKTFGYCDGNPHLLSAIIEMTTGMNTRVYANRELFAPLGIPEAGLSDWWTDPQGFSNGGYGLFLTPADLAKLAFLYLHDGKWDGQQILPQGWSAASTTQYIKKPEGPGYGYLWTVYPEQGRYSALGLGGQQIHVYPSRNLVVVVTAELGTFVEAPEIETMLNDFILTAIQTDTPLAENPQGAARLQAAVDAAANPLQPVPALPAAAGEIAGMQYTLAENAYGWQSISLSFEPGANAARIALNGYDPFEVGLDNVFRLTDVPECPGCYLRGSWADEQTFTIEYLTMNTGTLDIHMKFSGSQVEIGILPAAFGGEPYIIKGSR